jgi:hypothetical protein
VKSIRNKYSWKIRVQRQISNWRKELSVFAESGTASNNIKLNIRRRFFQKNKVRNAREVAQLIEKLK